MTNAMPAVAPRYREYETIYLLRPTTTAETATKVAGRVREAVAREGGKLTLVETWGRRLMAYPVKGHKRGIYMYVKYAGPAGLVSEIERNLRMLDEVIKFQTVLVQDEVELESVAVDGESVEFEALELPEDDEVDPSFAQSLGLEGDDGSRRRDHYSRDDDRRGSREEDDEEGDVRPGSRRDEAKPSEAPAQPEGQPASAESAASDSKEEGQ